MEEYLKEDVGRLLFLRLLTAKAILKAAVNRKQSLGAHYIKNWHFLDRKLIFLRLLTAKSILNSALGRKNSLEADYIKENWC